MSAWRQFQVAPDNTWAWMESVELVMDVLRFSVLLAELRVIIRTPPGVRQILDKNQNIA
jgi:hypothetical protein